MRILYLTDRLSLLGGADQHLRQIVEWAVSTGHRVSFVCGRTEGDVEPIQGISTHRIRGLAAAVPTSSRLGDLSQLLEQSDLIHVQNIMNPVALAMATRTGRAIVTVQDHRFFCPGPGRTLPDGRRCRDAANQDSCAICLDDEAYRGRMLGLTEARRKALDGARLIVLSHYMAGELAEAGLPGAVVLPPRVDVGDQEAEVHEGTGFVIGGRLVQHKAVVDAWHAWQTSGTAHELLVAGAGPLESTLVGATLHGWLDQPGLSSLLTNARALLFPGFWQEPFGILGLQALAMGTPVILAASGGVDDWSAAGCIRVEPGNIPAMAAAINRLADDPEEALRLGKAGRRHVGQHFGRKTIERRLLEIYESQ